MPFKTLSFLSLVCFVSLNVWSAEAPKKPVVLEPIKKISANHYQVPRSRMDDGLTHLGEVLPQMSCMPHVEKGITQGMRLINLSDKSVFKDLGFSKGELILSGNGILVTDAGKAMELLSQLQTAQQVKLQMKDAKGKSFVRTFDIIDSKPAASSPKK
ncbi:MAG: hypothetical protein EOP09_17740 [Proteobacteria bacterium]|nr:MAG: hypothetical protein EOP09_17740 [Pseudomonadota bacterium]